MSGKTSNTDILYNYPEDFPIPDGGFDHWDILSDLLDRARGVLRAVINDCGAGDTAAIRAVEGMMIQGLHVVGQLEKVQFQTCKATSNTIPAKITEDNNNNFQF